MAKKIIEEANTETSSPSKPQSNHLHTSISKHKRLVGDAIPTTIENKDLGTTVKQTKTFIKVIAWSLAAIFGWLEIREYLILPKIDEQIANIFYKVVLAIYYLLWVNGTMMDLDDEKYTIQIAPKKGKLNKSAIVTIITLGIVFGILCWVQTAQEIAIVISIFFVVNVVSWRYLLSYIKNPIAKSKIKYKKEENYIGLKKMDLVEEYLYGNWQANRFIAGMVVLIALDVIVIFNLSSTIAASIGIQSSLFIVVLLFCLYICIMEIWVWEKRLHKRISFRILEDLELEYYLIVNDEIENNEFTE